MLERTLVWEVEVCVGSVHQTGIVCLGVQPQWPRHLNHKYLNTYIIHIDNTDLCRQKECFYKTIVLANGCWINNARGFLGSANKPHYNYNYNGTAICLVGRRMLPVSYLILLWILLQSGYQKQKLTHPLYNQTPETRQDYVIMEIGFIHCQLFSFNCVYFVCKAIHEF